MQQWCGRFALQNNILPATHYSSAFPGEKKCFSTLNECAVSVKCASVHRTLQQQKFPHLHTPSPKFVFPMHTNFQIPDDVISQFRSLASSESKPEQRFLQVRINKDTESFELVPNEDQKLTEDFAQDYANLHKGIENPEKDCSYFIMWIGDFLNEVRNSQDSQNRQNWLLLWYVAPKASVKDRMLYASSLSLLPDTLGNQYFVGNYQITEFEELQDASKFQYVPKSERYLEAQKYMTNSEREVQKENKSISSVVTTSNVKGIEFPLAAGIEEALTRLSKKEISLVVLRVEDEQIELDDMADKLASPEEIQTKLPEKLPRFLFYVYEHTHEDAAENPIVFIYVCPSSSKVNQRMIYSTTKNPLQSQASDLGLKADFSIETSDRADITADLLNGYVHPQKKDNTFIKKRIKRPGKGRRRVAQ